MREMNRFRNVFGGTVKKSYGEILILGLYLALTLIQLYPFSVLKMDSELIGIGHDGYQSLWNLWWVKRSILGLSSPYVTDHLYYPYGADLYVHTLSPAAGFLTIPFQLTFGLIFSYNLIVILSFVLAGYGAYRLAYYITNDKKASFFGGLVFSFSAYHFARALEHMNLVSIQWMPFYVLFLLKMTREKSLKNVFFATTFLILTGLMADLQYVFFLGMLTAFFVAYELVSDRKHIAEFLIRLGSMTVVSSVILGLFFAPVVVGFFSGRYEYAVSSPADSVSLSADLLTFLTPNGYNLFFGNLTTPLISSFSSSTLFPVEGVAYVGYIVLALAMFAARKATKTAKFWLFSSLAFIVLSLGPMLHIMGYSAFTVFRVNIPLPELALYYAFPVFRVPARIIVMAILCLAVVSAMALKSANVFVGKRKNGRFAVLVLLAILSSAFIVESNMLPYPIVEDTSVPLFYHNLATLDGNFSVLDLPQTYQANNLYMYYSTVSDKALVGGSISRISPENLLLLQAFPIIRQVNNVLIHKSLTEPTDIIQQNINLTNLNSFQFFGVKYIVLHKNFMDNSTFERMVNYLDFLVGEAVYSDAEIVAYETQTTSVSGMFSFAARGWWNLEERNSTPTRWMESNGAIQVNSPSTQHCTVNFTVGTDYTSKTLRVYLNHAWIGNIRLSPGISQTILTQEIFRKGINEISFSSDQTVVPAEVNVTSSDTRRLSVYFQNIEITPI